MAQIIQKLYSDIDFAFTPQPVKKDIALSYDDMAVIRAVRYLLLTNNYERPFQPNIGGNLDQLLFEPVSPITASSLKTQIEKTIENFEPRVQLHNVAVGALPDQNAYNVTIQFYIGNNVQPTEINLLLQRTR